MTKKMGQNYSFLLEEEDALMRKMVVMAVSASMALCAWAGSGIKYKGDMKTEGGVAQEQKQRAKDMSPEEKEQMRKMGMSPEGSMDFSFEAMAADGKFKMTYLTDYMMFHKGSYMVGDNATRKAYFVFPATKQYVEMDVNQMNAMAKSMKSTRSNQRVDVAPLPPKVINGMPCTGKRVHISYDAEATVMGFHNKSHEDSVTDYYTNPAMDVMALFGGRNWQAQGLATGDEAFDKEVQQKVGFLGLPVQVVMHHTANGKDQGTTTLTTRDVQMTVIPGSEFVLPAGYAKTTMMGMMMPGGAQGGAGADEGQPNKRPSLKDMLKGLGH